MTLADGSGVNVGFSPGDSFSAEPYAYVGPHDLRASTDGFCNAPFGAVRTYAELRRPTRQAADAFIAESLRRVGPRPDVQLARGRARACWRLCSMKSTST